MKPKPTFKTAKNLFLAFILGLLASCDCKDHITATGKTVDLKKEAVVGALISVNGESTTSDAKGNFKVEVLKKDKYVVVVSKPGYRIMSKVFLKGIVRQDWVLTQAFTSSADPTRPIDVTDQTPNCPMPVMARVRWDRFSTARKVKLVQPDGSIADAPSSYETVVANYLSSLKCNTGSRVRMPARALVNGSGQEPAGQVNVNMTTISLISPTDMPGDFTVRSKKGSGYMKSYGAMGVEITDSDGTLLQLKDGITARLSIPVDPIVIGKDSKLDASIPLMVYDIETSSWEIEGDLKLDSTGTFYEADVSHFSSYNSDLLKTDQACFRIDASAIDGDFGLTISLMEYIGAPIEATVNYTIVNEPNCEGQKVHAIYNLPPNKILMLFAYQPVDNSGEVTPVMSITFAETLDPQDPSRPNDPVCPYTACKGSPFVINPVQ